jgi:hypothetical protein
MSLYEFETGRYELLAERGRAPSDQRALYVRLHAKLNELRADGVDVPEDLAELERELFDEMCAESQGR